MISKNLTAFPTSSVTIASEIIAAQMDPPKRKKGRPKKSAEPCKISSKDDDDDEYNGYPKQKRKKESLKTKNVRKVAFRNPEEVYKPVYFPIINSDMNLNIVKKVLLGFPPGKVIKLLTIFNCSSEDVTHEGRVNTFINTVIPKFDNISKKNTGNLLSLIMHMETRYDHFLIFNDPPLPLIFTPSAEKKVIYHNNNIEPRIFQVPIDIGCSHKFAVIAYNVAPFSPTVNLQPILVNHHEIEPHEFGEKHIPFYILYSGFSSNNPLQISLPISFDNCFSWTVIKYVKWRTPEVVAEDFLHSYNIKAIYSTLDDIKNVNVTSSCGCVFSIVDFAKQMIDSVSLRCPRCSLAINLKAFKVTSDIAPTFPEGNITIKDAERLGEAIARNDKSPSGVEYLESMIIHHYCPFEFAPEVGPKEYGQLEDKGVEAYLEAFDTY